MDHLTTYPPHSEMTRRPTRDLSHLRLAIPKTGGICHPIRTIQLESLSTRTPQIGAHPAPCPPSPSSTNLLHPERPPTPRGNHTEPQIITELVSIVKTASEALRNAIWVAKGLVRQVNAERWMARKPKWSGWSTRGDTCGNTVHTQPLPFPSERGVPVTGSLGDSEVLA